MRSIDKQRNARSTRNLKIQSWSFEGDNNDLKFLRIECINMELPVRVRGSRSMQKIAVSTGNATMVYGIEYVRKMAFVYVLE